MKMVYFCEKVHFRSLYGYYNGLFWLIGTVVGVKLTEGLHKAVGLVVVFDHNLPHFLSGEPLFFTIID